MNKLQSSLLITLFLTFFSSIQVFASAGPCYTPVGEPCTGFFTQLLGNGSQAGTFAQSSVTSANSIATKIKDYSLNPIATKIANNLINRALNDTYSWMKSGFQGGGPGFIVNPDAYFKNVANQEIRIQLDSINKSNSPYKNAISVALIKNIRSGRTTIGAQLNTTLFNTIQQETCAPQNLDKIATQQVDSGLGTNLADSSLTRAEKIQKAKATLSNTFCTGTTNSDPQAQAKLQACFNNGACGGMASTLAAYNPANTQYGQSLLAIGTVKEKEKEKVETQKGKTVGGLIPKEICTVRLQVDDTDNPYPPGEGPCVEWNTQTPVELVAEKFKQTVSQNFGKINNVQGFADLLGGLAENFLSNQVEKALYSGLSSSLSSGNSKGNLNLTYDNLLSNSGKALPAELLPKSPAAIAKIPLTLQITKAVNYCANQKDDKKMSLSQICNHIDSIKKTNTIDKSYFNYASNYLALLNRLQTCSENGGGQSYATTVSERKSKLDSFSNLSLVQKRISLYDQSMTKLSIIVIQIAEGNDTITSNALIAYSSLASDEGTIIPYLQEKLASNDYDSLKRVVDFDIPTIQKDATACEATLCTGNFRGGCSDPSNTPPSDQNNSGWGA